MLEQLFKLKENRTSVRTEILAGITTALTCYYIIIVNPLILSEGGAPFGAVYVATIVAAAISCALMAFVANAPIAVASGMGLNSFISFTVCLGLGYTYTEALGAVFIAGILFVILSLTKAREWLVNSIPLQIKISIAAAIGMFIAMIGFQIGGVVVDHPATLVTVGNIKDPTVILCLLGVVAIVTLQHLKVRGAIILTILALTLIGWIFGLSSVPEKFISMPPKMELFWEMDIGAALSAGMLSTVAILLFVDFTDTTGTLVACSSAMGKVNRKGEVKGIGKMMAADSIGTVVGAACGTTTQTSFVESSTGIREGGRTGLTALTVAVMFLIALFFSDLAISIPKWADAPCLIAVGFMFMAGLKDLDFSDPTEYAPGLLAVFAVPFSYSIAVGIQLAMISFVLLKVTTGKFDQVNPAMWVLAAASVGAFIIS
jgi:AGZA family xanthine/uracil permease-like MFS transporter